MEEIKHTLKLGDVVYLKSGSPALTVYRLVPVDRNPNLLVEVIWLNEQNAVQKALFPTACLANTPTSPATP